LLVRDGIASASACTDASDCAGACTSASASASASAITSAGAGAGARVKEIRTAFACYTAGEAVIDPSWSLG
jgi:hypothetical protein